MEGRRKSLRVADKTNFSRSVGSSNFKRHRDNVRGFLCFCLMHLKCRSMDLDPRSLEYERSVPETKFKRQINGLFSKLSNWLHIWGSGNQICGGQMYVASFHRPSLKVGRGNSLFLLQSRPLVRSALCPKKIDHTSGLTLHLGYNIL